MALKNEMKDPDEEKSKNAPADDRLGSLLRDRR